MAYENLLFGVKDRTARITFDAPSALVEKRPAKFQGR